MARFDRVIFAAFVALLPWLAGCARTADSAPVTSEDAGPYIIGAGDQLSIFVYDAPQLSVTIPVRPDGFISAPLVSDIAAAGKTPTQLADGMKDRLKKFIHDPIVTVMVTSFVGPFDRQIRVIGEAAEPQAIAFRQHMTLLDVMIQTKGLTRYAAGNSSILVRHLNGKDVDYKVRLSDLIKDGDIKQNLELQPGDTLIIPQSWF